MTQLQDATFCVVDTETTGIDPLNDKLCEIAFVLTTREQVIFMAETMINPGIPIPPEASAVHHIIDRHVADAPAVFPYGIKLPARQCYVAHNAEFDSAFLPQLARTPWLCTMRLARHVLPGLGSYKNQYLRYLLKLEVELPEGALPHRALPDAIVTAALLRHPLAKLPPDAPTTVEELVPWTHRPCLLTTCYFGQKHRGTPWADVPKDYLKWMLANCTDLDADTRFTAEHHLKR